MLIFRRMMMAPQIVGVLLKKPGHQNPRVPPFDQETKIRGEMFVEELGERKMVSIRMGWLWVEGTPMRLALRALNLRQASSGLCQSGLGFTLSNSKNDPLATFWVDSEPIYWSWVRAIAAELVRQTPFRAQRCLNFLEILTICPRGPLPLPDSPTDQRRRSRSELRCWFGNGKLENNKNNNCNNNNINNNTNNSSIIDDQRRRARSELRGWSSSNSSDEDIVGEFRAIIPILPSNQTRTWGCSESSEGSDDSLPWTSTNTTPPPLTTIILSDAPTSEQRIQRYKEARRRENEARTKRVLEEDAKKKKAQAEINNNNTTLKYEKLKLINKNNYHDTRLEQIKKRKEEKITIDTVDSINIKLPPTTPTVRFKDQKNIDDKKNNNNLNNNYNQDREKCVTIVRVDSGERKSRTRERRNFRSEAKILQDYKDKLNSVTLSRIPVAKIGGRMSLPSNLKIETSDCNLSKNCPSVVIDVKEVSCEENVARLLERCQRVDHYVPVREKLTLFESLSRMGGRLARSTEDLGRSINKTSPKGKQRARSLHDLNRGAKALPVREMCRLFEGEQDISFKTKEEHQQLSRCNDPPCVRASTRRKNYQK